MYVSYFLYTSNLQLKRQSASIQKLIDANNSLAERVIEYEERKKEKAAIIRDYILKYHRTVPKLVATEIAKNIMIASDKYNLPPILIASVMERESRFIPTLISKKGARGLMQIMRVWVTIDALVHEISQSSDAITEEMHKSLAGLYFYDCELGVYLEELEIELNQRDDPSGTVFTKNQSEPINSSTMIYRMPPDAFPVLDGSKIAIK